MSDAATGKYLDFLETLGTHTMPVAEIACDMQIDRGKVSRYVKKAEGDGLAFEKIHDGGRLVTIRLRDSARPQLGELLIAAGSIRPDGSIVLKN